MPGDVISLNQARKKRKRAEDEAVAAANRARFGRAKADKKLTAAQADQAAQRLEGHRLIRDLPQERGES
jgi:hypothetical protein